MGYTHYWEHGSIDSTTWAQITADFEKIVPVLEKLGVKLAGGFGTGNPEIHESEIRFNGVQHCGCTPNKNVMIPWPAKGASGVAASDKAVSGTWYAGASLSARTCDGDCSYETFSIEPHQSRGSCKTAYRPYDLAVNCCLIIAEHHAKFRVNSDGNKEDWKDAIQLCQHFLGYGEEFDFSR